MPSEEDLQIAHLLALGLKDEAVIKHLAMSHRTYRRRVRDLMDKLGARSRFEAGVLAERAGWIRHRYSLAGAAPRHESLGSLLRSECDAVATVAEALSDEEFSTPTACEAWDVKALLAHMLRDLLRVPRALEQPDPAITDVDAVDYWKSYNRDADAPRIANTARETAALYRSGAELVAALKEMSAVCGDLAGAHAPERGIELWWGPRMRLDEFLKTRIAEIVVHGIDLTDALALSPVARRSGVRLTVGILDQLLGQHPPHELRWSAIDYIRKATGRVPLRRREAEVLGDAAVKFPLLA